MTVRDKLYTVEEFLAFVDLPENRDKTFELVHGEIIEMSSSSLPNSLIAIRIATHLTVYAEQHNLGHVFGADGGYQFSETNFRIPDVSFVPVTRLSVVTPHWKGVPDLAVEVVSPSETAREVRDKINLYLDSGVLLVWVIYPESELVDVYQRQPDGNTHFEGLSIKDTLEGGDVLRGFHLPIAQLFKKVSYQAPESTPAQE